MASTLFISYRRNNGQFYAQLLHALLEKHKYNVFLDKESLHQGRFDEQIFRHIENCDYFLLLLTPGAFDRIFDSSDWMRLEIEHAFRCNKKIIPIIDEFFIYPNFLPDSLQILPNYQSIITNTADPNQIEFVVQQLEKYIPVPGSKKILLIGVALILISAGVFFTGQSTSKVEDPIQTETNHSTKLTDSSETKSTANSPKTKSTADSQVTVNNSKITENNRTIVGDRNRIEGDGNIIKGNLNKIYGNNNQVYGNLNKMHGRGNRIMSGNNNKSYEQ